MLSKHMNFKSKLLSLKDKKQHPSNRDFSIEHKTAKNKENP